MKHNDQVEIITQYLKLETNYAVIIIGDYGVGKTYFFKKILDPRIREISLASNEAKKFIPIHVSLFGLKSLEDVQTAIFLELYPILKNKRIKLAASIGKSLIRGVALITQGVDIGDYIGDVKHDANDWLKFNELVICLDDLDRKSEALDVRDVFGFINSLVENQGAKILIIANESQLLKDDNYSSMLREKVVGVSIQYKPEASEIYTQIITQKYSSSDKLYFEFLSKNSELIVDSIEKNQNNFRNLVFFLEHFKTIFYPLEQLFQSNKDFSILKEEKLRAILNFSLAISIEYKLGFLNATNLNSVQNMEKDLVDINIRKFIADKKLIGNEGADKADSYSESLQNKYFFNTKYYFFKSIFNYITGVKAFKIEALRLEIEGYFLVQDGKIPDHEKLLSDLSYLECLQLTDKQYRQSTMKLLSYLDQGVFSLRQYPSVFQLATRFNNILSFDLEKLKKRFRKSLQKNTHNFIYTPDLDFYISINGDTEFKDDINEIIKLCLETNDKLKETKNDTSIKDLLTLFSADFYGFIEKVSERDGEFRFSPFWIEFNVKAIIQKTLQLENLQIWKFGHYFKNRYRRSIFEDLYPEKQFVIQLKEGIISSSSRKNKTLKNASLDFLTSCLIEAESNFLT